MFGQIIIVIGFITQLKLKNIYHEKLLRDYSNKKVSKTSLAALALNALVCLCVPGFGIATEPGLHLKL